MTAQATIETQKESDLTLDEHIALSFLSRGREKAISVKILCELMGMNKPKLRALIEHLLDDHGNGAVM